MAYSVLDFLVEAICAMFGVDLAAANPHARAYRKAWKRRIQSNDPSPTILENVLRERHVLGAYGPHDAPDVMLMYRAWEAEMFPQNARKAFGRKFDHEAAS